MQRAAIPYESRILRGLRRREEDREFVVIAERISRETGTTVEMVLQTKLPGDPVTLRGIPVQARGVGGAIHKTTPGWFSDV